jgi:hypothetical protein
MEALWFILIPLLIVLGIVLRRWMKVFALIPATFLTWAGAAALAHHKGLSLSAIVATAFLFGACLQLGYLAGAFLLPFLDARKKKRALTAARR